VGHVVHIRNKELNAVWLRSLTEMDCCGFYGIDITGTCILRL
jgi:hypothetical protein